MFKLNAYAFCKAGNYLVIDKDVKGLALFSSYGGTYRKLYEIMLPEKADIEFLPWQLSVKSGKSRYDFCFFGKNGLFIQGKGEPLVLNYVDDPNRYNVNFIFESEKGFCIGDTLSNGKTYFVAQTGKAEYDAPMNTDEPNRKFWAKRKFIRILLSGKENGFSVALEQCLNEEECTVYKDFNYSSAAEECKNEYQKFEKPFIEKNPEYASAAYILWSNMGVAEGYFKRKPIFGSKAGMTRVWSWDNVFNALALCEFYPEMAMDQLMIPYDCMSKTGKIPDTISACTMEWTNVKPPVQGWTFQIMMKKNAYFSKAKVIEEAYLAMKHNTDWWLNFKNGIPLYLHGNDSGSDNSTCFDNADCIASPDLIAFLAIQCECLSVLAEKLGLFTDCRKYKEQSDRLIKHAEEFFDGRIFVRDGNTGQRYDTDSLMPLRVLLLGEKLPLNMREYIISRLKKDFLSEYGLTSEALTSKKYMEDGYWRGSIWNPDQYMMYDACMKIGEFELANKIIKNFKDAVKKSAFYENYDPHTGKGQRCKNYCWSVSAFCL